jgi:phosphoribosylaminoimidazole-succinocarboxamide synthase
VKVQEKFAEGKTKILYSTDQEDHLLMEFTDTLPFDTAKKSTMKGKGIINSEISSFLFGYLQSYNVPTHFIKRIDDKSSLVRRLAMIPLQMMIWNTATGSLSKRLGISEGTVLETPVLEYYLKNAKLKYPMINDYHAFALGLCDRNDMSAVVRIGTKVNAVLKSFFQRKNLALINFSLEFGKSGHQVMLGDEISPDTLTVWGINQDGKFDKKTFQLSPETAKTIYPRLDEIILK